MGFWSTLGKVGAIAAPIVAAPFTGGASLALIGAGAGAAEGALSGGGIKGALLGAGIGGATAGLMGGGGGAMAKGTTSLGRELALQAIPAGMSLIGSSLTAKGSKHAADLQYKASQDALAAQTKSVQDALDWQKAQHAEQVAAYAPFLGISQAAALRLSSLLASPPQTSQGRFGTTVAPPQGSPVSLASLMPQGQAGPQQGTFSPLERSVGTAQAPPAQTVMLRAPNGQTQAVPADQVAHYLSRGAQRMGVS